MRVVHKDWLQGEQGDASGIAGKAEAVLVDPSCSNSGTLDPSWSRTRSDASADGAEMEAEGFAGSGVHGGKGGAYVERRREGREGRGGGGGGAGGGILSSPQNPYNIFSRSL